MRPWKNPYPHCPPPDAIQRDAAAPCRTRLRTVASLRASSRRPPALPQGVVPRVMFLAPLASITLSFYEKFAMLLVSARLRVPLDSL